MKTSIFILALLLASCSPKAYQQVGNKPVKFKRSIDPKFKQWATIGIFVGAGIIAPVLYEEVPEFRKYKRQ